MNNSFMLRGFILLFSGIVVLSLYKLEKKPTKAAIERDLSVQSKQDKSRLPASYQENSYDGIQLKEIYGTAEAIALYPNETEAVPLSTEKESSTVWQRADGVCSKITDGKSPHSQDFITGEYITSEGNGRKFTNITCSRLQRKNPDSTFDDQGFESDGNGGQTTN